MNEIRRYAVQNRIRYSRHGYDRMDERGVTRDDIRHALCVFPTTANIPGNLVFFTQNGWPDELRTPLCSG